MTEIPDMCQSLMVSVLTDHQGESAPSESLVASEYLERYLPNEGDSEFFFSDSGECWIQITNVDGRIRLEIGEPAA